MLDAARRLAPLLLLMAVAAAPACRSVPNVGPFVDATSALHVVVAAVGTEIESQLVDVDLRHRFKDTWERRVAAMQAMADYASGLAQVVEAGRSGEMAAAEVLGGAKQLLDTVGAAFPGTDAATAAVSNALAKVYGRLAQDRAAATVAAAIEYADPSIRELARALAEDFQTLEQLVRDWRNGATTTIEARAKEIEKGGGRLLKSLQDAATDKRVEAAKAGNTTDRAALIAEATQFETLARQEMSAEWYVKMTADLDRIDKAAKSRGETIHAAAAAMLAWSASHADLARASQTGMTPNFAVLTQLTHDLLGAYAEAKKQ